MALPISFWGQTLNDNTLNKKTGAAESASYRVPIITLTAANLVATQALLATLASATQGISNGVVRHTTTLLDETAGSGNRAPSTSDQRENKYLVRYHDVVVPALKFRVSVPVADLSILPDGDEFLDLTAGPGLAYKDAFEAVVRSPADGSHAVGIDSIQFVGRNT